jgi:hypothetical protein
MHDAGSALMGIGAAAVLLAAVSLAPAYFSALIADTLTKLF